MTVSTCPELKVHATESMEDAGKTVRCEQTLNSVNGNFRGLCVMLFNCWNRQASERRLTEMHGYVVYSRVKTVF